MDPLPAIPILSLPGAGECPYCFLWHFLRISESEWRSGQLSASRALGTEHIYVGIQSEQEGSEDSLRDSSISRAFRQIFLSF